MFRIEILNILIIILIMSVFCIRETFARAEPRVVGGKNVQTFVPYQISLQMKIEDRRIFKIPFFTKPLSWSHICGGSIIGKYHILTAAHCVDGMEKDTLTVVVGTIRHEEGGVRHFIDWIIMHPGYKKLETSDIAIIKLKTPIKYNRKVKPINVTDEKLVGEEPVILTGWGYSWPFRFGSLPDVLQIIEMKTLTNENCNETGHKVTPTEICAFRSFLSGACAGDSGGPLVNIQQTKQIGVVSYGTAVCGIGFPDVFTRVSVFVSWIGEQMMRVKPPDANDTSTGNDSTTEQPIDTTTVPTTTLVPTGNNSTTEQPDDTSTVPTTTLIPTGTTDPTTELNTTTAEPNATTPAEPNETTTAEPNETTTAEPNETTSAEPNETTSAERNETTTTEPNETPTTEPNEATTTTEPNTTISSTTTKLPTDTEIITTPIPLSSTSESDMTSIADVTSETITESNTEVNNDNEIESNTETGSNVEVTTAVVEDDANTDNKETGDPDAPDAEAED